MTLPKIDGWQLIRLIKADEKLRSIFLVAVTALAMKGDEEKARAVGCDGYVTKPIDHDLLHSVLNQLLEKSEH
ncbi:MAG: response regulator [Desulfobulbia bacterium]